MFSHRTIQSKLIKVSPFCEEDTFDSILPIKRRPTTPYNFSRLSRFGVYRLNEMTTEELDFSKICRVCCLSGKLLSLFKVHLNRKLMACSNLRIWKDDGLPESICARCVSRLHIAFQFKKTCERSDARLRNYLEEIEANKEKAIIEESSTIEPELTQMQSSIPLPNYVIVTDCNPTISAIQGVNKQYGNGITSFLGTQSIQPNGLAYSLNSMGILDGLTNGGYAIQQVSVPVRVPTTTMYQTFNVPPNGFAQPITVSSVPLQPIVTADNHLVVASESTAKNDNKPPEDANKLQNQKATPHRADEKCNGTTCSTCGKTFVTPLKLSRHMKTHSQTFTHVCKICHKGFTHGGNFKVHMRMHNDERPYSCPMCDHRCRQLQDLEKHKRKHNGERPYICRYCSKGFSTSSNLISHERIHTLEKPYICSICQKAFCQSNELTKHFRTHTQEKSHTCKVCHKGFNGSSTLIVHMRTHSGERPHICQYCHRGFSQSSCLKVHVKRHERGDDKDFQCDQCPRRFISNSSFKEHLASHCGPEDDDKQMDLGL